MTQRENESIDASARAKLGEDRSVSERIRTADTVARLVKLLLGIVIAATLGLAGIWYAQADAKKRLDEFDRLKNARDLQWESQKTYNAANDKLLEAQKTRIDELRKDFDATAKRIDKWEPDVMDMIFMRDNGISNKERFLMRHGYQAPTSPMAEQATTPHR
jgi:uncharacterized protein HemX